MEIEDILSAMIETKKDRALKGFYRALIEARNDLNLPVNVLKAELVSYEIKEDDNTIYYGFKAVFNPDMFENLEYVTLIKEEHDLTIGSGGIIII